MLGGIVKRQQDGLVAAEGGQKILIYPVISTGAYKQPFIRGIKAQPRGAKQRDHGQYDKSPQRQPWPPREVRNPECQHMAPIIEASHNGGHALDGFSA